MRWILMAYLFSALAPAAAPTPYYWGMAENLSPEGRVTKTLVLGHRVMDTKSKRLVDTQHYFSPGENAQYRYEFDFNSGKLTGYLNGQKKPVGEGTFKCNGSLEKHTSCTYTFEVKGEGAYISESRDIMENPALVYREESQLFFPGKDKPVRYTVDFVAIEEAFYKDLKNRLQPK